MLYYLLLIIEFLTFDVRFGRAVCNLLGAINNRLQLSFQTANRLFLFIHYTWVLNHGVSIIIVDIYHSKKQNNPSIKAYFTFR
jgi:hypothetical protein